MQSDDALLRFSAPRPIHKMGGQNLSYKLVHTKEYFLAHRLYGTNSTMAFTRPAFKHDQGLIEFS